MKDVLDRIDENTWIISDTHLGHKNILAFEPGRLAKMLEDGYTEDQHDHWIVDTWNKTVKPGETVLHLGDFAFKGVADYISKLNGDMILVLGNHDDKPYHSKFDGADVIDGIYFETGSIINKVHHEDRMLSGFIKEIKGTKYLFSHYPVFDDDEWDRQNKRIAPRIELFEELFIVQECDSNVHGHNHSKESSFEHSFNACFEHTDFKPIRLGDLLCMH